MTTVCHAHSFPLNNGLPSNSSPNIHPIDHTSTVRIMVRLGWTAEDLNSLPVS